MSGLFGGSKKTPEPEAPAEMPDEDDPAKERSRRNQMRRLYGSSGRASTRLTDVPGTLGREYSRSTLG